MEDNWRGETEGEISDGTDCQFSVVYKLVRVEGDGTLVPATDDDVIEVEHMLHDDKKEAASIECDVHSSEALGRPTSVKDKRWLKHRLSASRVAAAGEGCKEKEAAPAAKRMRKPTRRYIEESSDVENREGFVVQVPCAPRAHRSRPRTNFLTFVSDTLIGEGKSASEEDRRKHHRVWTPWEVARLVDGVSKYGAGRWSQIRRLAFPSHSRRTSVDLKDKWRNLLRACYTEKGVRILSLDKKPINGPLTRTLPVLLLQKSTRQNNSAPPIPAWVLARVRELAEKPTGGPVVMLNAPG